jgi:hypothetical protein
MSDLQIDLLAIGVCIVAGVYAYNWWLERQFRRRTEEAFKREHADVLMPDEGSAVESVPDSRVEPSLEPSPAAAATPAPLHKTHVARESTALALDPVIDYVVEVELAVPAASSRLHESLMAMAVDWHKAVLVSGYDTATGEWQTAGLDGGGEYSQLRFAVQMSNRAGCIDVAQLAAFRSAVEAWARDKNAKIKCLEIELAHAMAVQLDRFCAEVDIAVGINVVTRDGTPFSATKIRALAEAGGFKLDGDGVFYLRGENGNTIYTLDNHEPMPFMPEQMKTLTTSGVTFLFDVPCVADTLRSFETMVTSARSFASTLGGRIVDDNRTVLSEDAIEKIRLQLTGILAKMEAGQIPAGGTRALRLFS